MSTLAYHVPLRNRVTPFGEIVALPARGTLMGNRGILHDAHQTVVRDWQVRRWIACRLEFRGRHRTVMQPNHYTELFFLDEATALADGHRPCAECRNAEYRAFQRAWQAAHPDQAVSADAIDRILHAERRAGPFRKRTHRAALDALPDGAFVAIGGRAWLVLDRRIVPWSDGRYAPPVARPSMDDVIVLTPPSILDVLRAGYRPRLDIT